MIHIDSNIILDVLRPNPDFVDKSESALRTPVLKVIGPVVYAEIASGFRHRPEVDSALQLFGISLVAIGEDALFAAGHAFYEYRKRGGPRTSILPDFFIGAHALASSCPLLTRDPGRYRTAFPKLTLIEP